MHYTFANKQVTLHEFMGVLMLMLDKYIHVLKKRCKNLSTANTFWREESRKAAAACRAKKEDVK